MTMKLQNKQNNNLKTIIMKTTIQKLGMIICSFLFLTSCTKDEGQVVVQPDTTPVSATSMLKFSGTFESRAHNGSGKANIYQDGTVNTLKLENFTVDGGPDLKVYLSKSENPKEGIINFGGITSTGTYTVPSTAVVADYKYVLIYCQAAGVLFVAAPLAAK
jgi:hypothetical protein